jgi:hypothetical protein
MDAIAKKPEDISQLLAAEYREAANAYFKRIEIGFSTVKLYLTLNGIFIAFMGAASEAKLGIPAVVAGTVKVIPWIGLALTIALVMALANYLRHLENCRVRCEEIESEFGGRLFTRMGAVTSRGYGINSTSGYQLFLFIILVVWSFFALRTVLPAGLLQSVGVG